MSPQYDADDSGGLDVHEFSRLAGTGGSRRSDSVFNRLYPEPPEEARGDFAEIARRCGGRRDAVIGASLGARAHDLTFTSRPGSLSKFAQAREFIDEEKRSII